MAAHIHAATHRMLQMIAEFDRLGGWKLEGHRSCAHWLAFRTGIDLGACRERVRTARALVGLPRISEAMSHGELSFSKVRALTRIADEDNEGELLELARCGTARHVEQVVRGWKMLSRTDEAERERVLHRSRRLSVFPGEDGMYEIRGRLDPEVGALLMRAIEAAADALWIREVGSDEPIEPEQRRADAIGLLAERALAAGLSCRERREGGPEERPNSGSSDDPAADAKPPDPARSRYHRDRRPVSGTRAERYQVVLHVDADTLDAGVEPGRSHLADGTRVSAETSRRLCCDASVVVASWTKRAADGEEAPAVLDVGRRTRTIPPALRRALELRDGGCRFPGCGLRFTDAHHITHWADGGETRMDNLLLLCSAHHRLVHEEGWTVRWSPGEAPEFTSPTGRTIRRADPAFQPADRTTPPTAPERAASADLVAALCDANERAGVRPDWRTATAQWRYSWQEDARVFDRVVAKIR